VWPVAIHTREAPGRAGQARLYRYVASLSARLLSARTRRDGASGASSCLPVRNGADPCSRLPVGPVENPVKIRRHKRGLLSGGPS